jgi:hypothetical protein
MKKQRSDIMALGITEDRRYSGPAIAAGGLINLSNANFHVLTPFKTIDAGRGSRTLYQAGRFYAARFTPGDPVIIDGSWGERGQAAEDAAYLLGWGSTGLLLVAIPDSHCRGRLCPAPA